MADESASLFGEKDSAETQSTNGSTVDRPRANSLDGRTWTRYSISIWSDIRKSQEELELGHMCGFTNPRDFQRAHREWVEQAMENGGAPREDR